MTEDELRNLMVESCYLKHTLPGPIHVRAMPETNIDGAQLLKAGEALVDCGYFKRPPSALNPVDGIDAILNAWEITPAGIDSFEEKLKKVTDKTEIEVAEAATFIIQLPWFGGRAYARSSSATESTTVNVDLKVALGNIVEQIDKSAASPEEKAEAKSRLKDFLKHPLVVAIAGAALKPLLANL